MKISTVLVAGMSVWGLAACSSGVGDVTRSSFKTPSGGVIPVNLSNEVNGSISEAGKGGVAYVVGTDDRGAAAYAGIIPGSDVGSQIISGTATYNANYEVAMIEDIRVSGNLLFGRTATDSGNISLTADFNGKTLRGSDGTLSVDGDIRGSDLSGDVRYRGVRGRLDGLIGSGGVIGAFHGNSDDMVYSGGFVD